MYRDVGQNNSDLEVKIKKKKIEKQSKNMKIRNVMKDYSNILQESSNIE